MAVQTADLLQRLRDRSVELCDEIKYSIQIIGIDNFESFIKKESDFWSKANFSPANQFVSVYNQVSTMLQSLKSSKPSPENEKQHIDQAWNKIVGHYKNLIKQNKIIFSNNPISGFLKDLSKENTYQASSAFNYFISQVSSINASKDNFLGALKAYEFEHQGNNQIVKRREQEEKSLDHLRSEWIQKTDELLHDFNDLKLKLEDWRNEFTSKHEDRQTSEAKSIEKFIVDKDSKLKELEGLYEEKLKLEGPAKYWRYRIKKHRTAGQWWFTLFSASIIWLIVIILSILYNLPEAFNYRLFSGDPQAIKGIILLATIISFGAYFSKVLSKLTFSSFHLQRDAEEREQLTLVYLALIKSGSLKENERDLILQALFSRADTGLLGGDSSPAMPGFSSVLDKIAK